MLLDKLLKPLINTFSGDKLQSRNPDIRKKAVQNVPVSDQETLNKIALNDSDEAIRAIAINKISNLEMLQTIVMKGTNKNLKQIAEQRLHQLLCGIKQPIPDFAQREKIIHGSRNSNLLEYVAEHADHASLRAFAIKKINRDPLLGNIALQDKDAQIRQLAAQQIAKRSTLERVAEKSRRKDKRVYKMVKSKLDSIIEDELRPALLAEEVLDICEKLEKLHKRNLLLQEKTTFENYSKRWTEIETFASEETSNRYHTICTAITHDLSVLEEYQQQQNDALLSLDGLLVHLSHTVDELLNVEHNDESSQEFIDSRKKVISNLRQEWDNIIKTISNDELVISYNAKFQTILELSTINDKNQNQNHQDDSNSIEKITNIIEQAEKMLAQSGFMLEKTIFALQGKFKQQIDNNNLQSKEVEQFQSHFETVVNSLNKQLSIQKEAANKLKDKLVETTDKINILLTDGHVSKAEKLLHDELALIKKSTLISNIEKQHYQDKLKQLQSQLGNLSSWRNWAHDNERKNLLTKAEKLLEQTKNSETLKQDYVEVIAQVKELRQQWKKMHSHSSEELWQEFNNTCNLTYEQCIPFIDKETEARQDNLNKKQIFCQQLEEYIASMAWPSAKEDAIKHSIDWIQVDKITHQARKEWSAIGFVERKEHKAINKRFDKAIEAIRKELKRVWQHNQEAFFNLIEQVEALHEELDENLPDAINKAKDYQKQWKKIGPVSSYQRNKLWKRFRKGCDVVFAKRQEGIDKKNDLNTEKLREKEAICENLEALNQQPLVLSDLKNAYKDIKTLWTELIPQAKALSQEVNQRYALAVEGYHSKIEQLLKEKETYNVEILQKKADLCRQIEQLDTLDEAASDQFKQDWAALLQQHENNSCLKQRFNQALKSISLDKAPLIESEEHNKHDFCLKYEILLGKDSPLDDQQARIEKQVELLNSNLRHSAKKDTAEQHSNYGLQILWYEFSCYAEDNQWQQRFNHLISD